MTLKEYLDFPFDRADDFDALAQVYGKVRAVSIRKDIVTATIAMESGIVADLSREYDTYTDLNKMSFGGFISCESALKNVNDRFSLYVMLLEQVLRPKGETAWDDLGEPHRAAIMDLRVEDAMFYVGEYFKGRESFHSRQYKDVFFRELEEWEKPSEDEDSQDSEIDKANNAAEASWEENWFWYSIIHELADGDVLRYESILRQPMELIAPEWSYRMGRAKLERQRMKQQEAISKARMRR